MTGFELILPFLRPIEHLILDPEISEIMVNGSQYVFIERSGMMQPVPEVSLTAKSLEVAVRNIARRLGDDISEEKPILDSRLRWISEEMDSASMETLLALGGQVCGSRGLAEDSAIGRGTRAKIRNIMSALYSHAIRWEWAQRNPITSVRQSAKRQRVPEILAVQELVELLGAIPEPFRSAAFLDGSSGLRVGELLGLKWEDVDFDHNLIHIRRSVVKQHIGPPKTEASQKPIPMDPDLANSLWLWKQETPYRAPYDWVYASPAKKGKQPYWPNSIYRVYIKPAAARIGITKRIGWHTFRHTFGTLLNANGENPKVIQELLRHANLRVTMDTYVQAVSDEKRNAQKKVVRMLLPGIGRNMP